MWTTCFLFLALSVGVQSLDCPIGREPCGTTGCFDSRLERCIQETGTIECLNSCNGACYLSSQYCYNDTIICNNNELICDVKYLTDFGAISLGPTCYDPSQLTCYNNTLCPESFRCGTECRTNYYSICVKNQKFCDYEPWNPDSSDTQFDLCGPQRQCYDAATRSCLNGITVCEKSDTQLCDTTCFNPNIQICINSTVRCLNSCNGECYSNSQYCYNNTKICNTNELVCDIKTASYFLLYYVTSPSLTPMVPFGLTCYDPLKLQCLNNALCYNEQVCGSQCLTELQSACVKNDTICNGFYFHNDLVGIENLDLCGSQKQCYDRTVSVCLGDDGIICPIGNQLCSGACYNPQIDHCTTGNSTVYCLNNPSAPECYTSVQPGD